MKKSIYLDNAATTKVHPDVLSAMMPYFCDYYGNAASSYSLGRASNSAIDKARIQTARLIGALPEEIYFTSGGSESDNWALKQAVQFHNIQKNKRFQYQHLNSTNTIPDNFVPHIITSAIEHNAILHTCQRLENEGIKVTYIKPNKNGIINPDDISNAILPETVLISIMAANNEVGTIQPLKLIGKIAKQNGIIFHTDAVQAYGHIPINVNECMIDMLSVSGHKLGGPKGTGFLYIRNNITLDAFINGGSQEKGMRAGTSNVPGIVGLGKAAELAHNNMQYRNRKIYSLRDHMISRVINEIPDSSLNGHPTFRLPNNANFCFKNIEGAALLLMLNSQGICASAGSACATGATTPSHVLLAMGIDSNLAKGAVRFTLSEENTIEEIDYTVDILKKSIHRLRKNK